MNIESPFVYLKAPFPWFGGKRHAAPIVWQLLGDVDHYVEPFAGSLANLLERPHPCNRAYYSETVNDLDGFVCNAWRAIALSPQETAEAASWPVCEADKTARQIRLLKWREEVALERLAGDPDWHDPVMAGWWLWAVACQIGAFSGDGAWTADPVTGRIVKQARGPLREPGVSRDLPHLSDDGQGVNTAAVREPGVKRNLPHLSDDGRGVNRPQLREPGVLDDDYGYHPTTMPGLRRWMAHLSARLRHVRVLNGGWERLCTTGAMWTLPVRQGGHVGVFLDPPYDNAERASGLYSHDCGNVAADCRDWCLANGDNSKNRIVLAGYDSEHTALEAAGWTVHEWFAAGFLRGGYGQCSDDGHQQKRERLWASPHCLGLAGKRQLGLFDDDLFGTLFTGEGMEP